MITIFFAGSLLMGAPKTCEYDVRLEATPANLESSLHAEVAAVMREKAPESKGLTYKRVPGGKADSVIRLRFDPNKNEFLFTELKLTTVSASKLRHLAEVVGTQIRHDCVTMLEIHRPAYAAGVSVGRQELEAVQAKYTEAQEQLEEAKTRYAEAARVLEVASKADIAKARAEADARQTELEAAQKKLEQVANELAAKSQQLISTTADLEVAEQERDDALASLGTAKEALEQSQQQFHTAEGQIDRSQSHIGNMRKTHFAALTFDGVGSLLLISAAVNGAYCADRWFQDLDDSCRAGDWRSVQSSLNTGIAGGVFLGVGVSLHVTALMVSLAQEGKKQQTVRWEGTALRF